MTHNKPKIPNNNIMERNFNALQQKSIAKLLDELHPDDPIRPVVEAMGELQTDLAAMQTQIAEATAHNVLEPQRLPEAKQKVFLVQLSKAIQTTAQALNHVVFKERELEYLVTVFLAMIFFGFAGVVLGAWSSETRSAEARRYWEWNQGLIAECQKQNKPTCNIHVVPPELW